MAVVDITVHAFCISDCVGCGLAGSQQGPVGSKRGRWLGFPVGPGGFPAVVGSQLGLVMKIRLTGVRL